MKVLILPSVFITNYVSLNRAYLKAIFKKILLFKLNISTLSKIKSDLFFKMDQYYFSEFPNILGKKNTFIIGDYNSHYKKKVPDFAKLPSLYHNPEATHISFDEAVSNLNNFDCLITGVRTDIFGKILREKAIKKNLFTVIIDTFDDLDVYKFNNTSDIKKIITRNFKLKKDFDLYLKHDVPLNFYDNNIIPIAPVPIKIENYPTFPKRSFEQRYNNIFFSGRSHKDIHSERYIVSNFLAGTFKKVKILNLENDVKFSTKEYCKILNNSIIAFSPSGKVWDSTRHSELGIYECVPLIPKPNCRLAENFLINETNSITYNFTNNKIQDRELLKNKINLLLNSSKNYKRMASEWKKNIYKNNTFFAKSKYIIDKIKESLSK